MAGIRDYCNNSSRHPPFSVRSTYDIAARHSKTPKATKWNAIWKLKIPSRIKMFLWLVRHEKIMTNNLRVKRGFVFCDKRLLCNETIEDTDHVLRKCPAADEIWRRIHSHFHLKSRSLSFQNWLDCGVVNRGNEHRPENENLLFALTIWWTWKWMNKEIFTGLFHPL